MNLEAFCKCICNQRLSLNSPRRLLNWRKFAKGLVQNVIDVGLISTYRNLVVKTKFSFTLGYLKFVNFDLHQRKSKYFVSKIFAKLQNICNFPNSQPMLCGKNVVNAA